MTKRGHGDEKKHSAKATPHGEILERLPPEIRKEIEGLRKHENRVLEALEDEEMHRLFIHDPAAALARLKIPMSALLRKRLQAHRAHSKSPPPFLCPSSFMLPNGRKVTPKIRVRFTGAKED